MSTITWSTKNGNSFNAQTHIYENGEMQFDVVTDEPNGKRSKWYSNLSIDGAKQLRARLDEFIERAETVTVTITGPKTVVNRILRNDNITVEE